MIRPLSIALLLALPLLAQDPVATNPTPTPRAKQPAITVSVTFAGGTLGQFVDLLRHQEPKANILVAPAALDAVLPRLELNGAGLEQALEAACSVADSAWLVRVKEFAGEGAPVFSILVAERQPSARSTGAPPTGRTAVYSLAQLTGDTGLGVAIPVETVLSAIEAATDGKLTLRFHRDSGLLIVRGADEQIVVAREVLSELENDVKQKRSEVLRKAGVSPADGPGQGATK